MSPLVVDAHVHVWGAELLDVPWLGDPSVAVLRRAFALDELRPVLRERGIDCVVLVAADETLAGTRLLLERGAIDPQVGAVVGWVDLVRPTASTALASVRATPGGGMLRGIRQSTADRDAQWWDELVNADSVTELERADLVLELLAPARDLPRVAALATRRPELRIVVDHLGHPPTPDDAAWRLALAGLATLPGVVMKVSGIPFDDDGFGVVVEFARTELGAGRLLAGSDWPVVMRRAEVSAEWNRLHRLGDGWPTVDRDALLGGTATRVYGIAA